MGSGSVWASSQVRDSSVSEKSIEVTFCEGSTPLRELAPSRRRDAYRDAIEKVRSQHSGSIKHATATVECPRCGTRQVLTDAPGMRVCLKCGFEFGRTTQG